jgi:predicted nucleic acid-binding protein
MKTLFDSSAFAKRYVEEVGSREVDALCVATSALALSVVCVPEIISALNRRLREKRLSAREYLAAKSRLSEEVADAVIINLTPEVIARTVFLLEANPLRALDAIHIACALEWGAELFVSCDDRQIKAARRAGLSARRIGTD